MTQEQQKRSAAQAALVYIEPKLSRKSVVGVGTGSTADYFIDVLATIKHKFDATVASSEASAIRLREQGMAVLDLNAAPEITVYVDGADEVDAGVGQQGQGAGEDSDGQLDHEEGGDHGEGDREPPAVPRTCVSVCVPGSHDASPRPCSITGYYRP